MSKSFSWKDKFVKLAKVIEGFNEVDENLVNEWVE